MRVGSTRRVYGRVFQRVSSRCDGGSIAVRPVTADGPPETRVASPTGTSPASSSPSAIHCAHSQPRAVCPLGTGTHLLKASGLATWIPLCRCLQILSPETSSNFLSLLSVLYGMP